MKKIALLFLVFAFLGFNYSFASVSVKDKTKVETKTNIEKKDSKVFDFFKTKISEGKNKVKKVFNEIKEKLNNYSANLRTALILMVVGLIFLILAGAIGGNIVLAVGAIFFLIGAVLLLLEIL